ncbi:MAG: mandelate racemase/muconate lactonizing enzyme family protein [Chitinophagaceae bacterium]
MIHSLTISSIELYKLQIPLHEPFVISLGPIYAAENVMVIIRTREGLTGYGECSPFMTINGESADTGMVVGRYFANAMLGKDALALPERIAEMDRIIYGNYSIKSAFDMALYDLASKAAEQPLYAFLGGTKKENIYTDYTVSLGTPQDMASAALRIKQQGFPAIKVKLGSNGSMDVQRMRAIREAVGPDIPLRIDANQGWSLYEAINTLEALAPLNIQHCEEPIPRWGILDLPTVREKSSIPIMSDESCGDPHDAERLIRLKACDMLNIKLGKSGGIWKANQIVRLAEAAGIHLQVGAFMESRLAMSAFAHFACSSPLIEHYDFDTCLMFSEDPIQGGINYAPNGHITLPDEPGIGASIKEEWLEKLEKVVCC